MVERKFEAGRMWGSGGGKMQITVIEQQQNNLERKKESSNERKNQLRPNNQVSYKDDPVALLE